MRRACSARHRTKPLRRWRPLATAPAATLITGLMLGDAALAQGAAVPAAAASAPPTTTAPAEPAAPATAAEPARQTVLPVVRARAAAEPQGKDSLQATTLTIGKGKQDARDVPQSVTVVTEKLIDDRNLDTLGDVLRNTAGITFLAAEGGEQDVRLRGFSLQATGDVFVDGMRDPAFYERDTFFLDRVEVLRGSASMLFGRGSTGGAVNQVSKVPRLIDEHQVDVTMGSHGTLRGVGDFNLKLGESTALHLGAMVTSADNDGAGSAIDKRGVAATWRTGIGETNEFSVALYVLDNDNGMNYGLPWIRPTPTSPASETTPLPLAPTAYYGMASDINHGSAGTLTLSHTWRIARDNELVTRLRKGEYTRDQRASTIRFANAATQPSGVAASLETFGPDTVLNRATQLKIQDLDTLLLQSDLSSRFSAFGLRHHVLAGIDLANEKKRVDTARNAAQGGVNLSKPPTTVGTPDDGAWIDESLRVLRPSSAYESNAYGLYAQDLLEFTPQWKLLVGLRWDHLEGHHDQFAIPAAAPGPETTTSYRMNVAEWSERVGLLYQPNERTSFHLSGASSFNTSGDAYSLSAANANIPPEQSVNIEFGGRHDSADGNLSARFAIFRTTKLHERNTDPTVNLVTLSGKRHVAGFELDLSGRITPRWEVFGSYMWLPVAVIDQAAPGPGVEAEGSRPSLTPVDSGALWSTYQVDQALRVGAGLNWRSSQTPNRNPGWSVPGFVTGDLMAEYQLILDKLIFKAYLSNLADKLYGEALYTGHYIPGYGRRLELTGTYRF